MSSAITVNDIAKCVTQAYGIIPIHVEAITKGVTNTNFLIEAKGERFIFKIYNFKNTAQVGFEVGVLEELKRHTISAPRLVRKQGGLYVGEYQEKPFVLYSYIDGKPEEGWNESILTEVGAYMGAMHVALRDHKDRSKDGVFDLVNMQKVVRDGKERFKYAEYPEADELLSFVETCLASVSFPQNLPKGITHHDIKPENVILKNSELAGVVDFDLSYYGILLNDIATTIIWACFTGDELDAEKTKAFLRGYATERELEEIEWEYLGEAIYCRLVREVFSSPFDVLPNYIDITKPRSDMFKQRAILFKEVKDALELKV